MSNVLFNVIEDGGWGSASEIAAYFGGSVSTELIVSRVAVMGVS